MPPVRSWGRVRQRNTWETSGCTEVLTSVLLLTSLLPHGGQGNRTPSSRGGRGSGMSVWVLRGGAAGVETGPPGALPSTGCLNALTAPTALPPPSPRTLISPQGNPRRPHHKAGGRHKGERRESHPLALTPAPTSAEATLATLATSTRLLVTCLPAFTFQPVLRPVGPQARDAPPPPSGSFP